MLIEGSCHPSCPTGFYNYYSACLPCLYGCGNCIDSNTCLACSLGFLYQGLCLESCPSGWVGLDNSSVCEKCQSGCLKCSMIASQCVQCGNGLFLQLFSCVTECASGTYQDSSSLRCLTCPSPCQTCFNGYSCASCIFGYMLYAQPSGNQCIQGPSCPNSFFLDTASNQCLPVCPANLYVQPSNALCSRPCEPTFVLLSSNATCLE